MLARMETYVERDLQRKLDLGQVRERERERERGRDDGESAEDGEEERCHGW